MKSLAEKGFTLLEVLVVIAIIGILSGAIFINFNAAREQARDDALRAELELVRLALETYRAQFGIYPGSSEGDLSDTQCAGAGDKCTYTTATLGTNPYIPSLINEGFIPSLPSQNDYPAGCNFIYIVTEDTGDSYKLIAQECVSGDQVARGDKFARCPDTPSCNSAAACAVDADFRSTYAVYQGPTEQCE